MLGQTLGSYTVERELGRGGMGAVYTAVHSLLGRRAAVKVLLGELSKNQDIVQRFFNEARAATAIKHPSIVEIYDFGWTAEGQAYIVMELMDGESLAARLKRVGRLPAAQAANVARQVANALSAAHKAAIVHRDLKPDNVFLVPDVEVAGGERVKLLDFGIAKLAADGAVSRTTTGAIMGTPIYMSPEQCEGARQVDHRTDLYSLGCMLFEMVTGRVPFLSEGVGAIIGMHLHVAPPALRSLAPDAPPELEAIVARLLAKSPADRFQSADEVAAVLGRVGGTTTGGTAVTPPPLSVPPSTVGTAPTLSPTTLSAAAGGGDREEGEPRPGSSMRTLWIVLAATLVLAAVIVVIAVSGGSKSKAAAVVVVDAAEQVAAIDAPAEVAAIDAPPAIDAAGDHAKAEAALAAMTEAAVRHDWKAVRDGIDAVYDATSDGDPLRARGDDLINAARPTAIAEARTAIDKLARAGRCSEARTRADDTIAQWGDDARKLTAVAAACKTAPPVVPIDAGVSPPPEPPEMTRDMFLAAFNRGRARLQQCANRVPDSGGRYNLTITVNAAGRITTAEVQGPNDRASLCLERGSRSITFPPSRAGITVTVPLVLKEAPPHKHPDEYIDNAPAN